MYFVFENIDPKGTIIANPKAATEINLSSLGLFFDQLRSSSYQDQVYNGFQDDYQNILDRFMQNAVSRGELEAMPLEVYWSVAFSPLQSLIRAHYEGSRPGGTPFKMMETILWQTFDLILRALKK